MANRFQSNQYKALYPFIAQRDGEYCLACYIETGQRRGPKSVKLEIDHADGDKRNWSPDNLHLLCKTHNIKMRSLSPRAHTSLMAGYSAENERERVLSNEYMSATRRIGGWNQGSTEMQINRIAEANWLQFMHGMLDSNGSISKEDAINAGAIAADDVNIQTTARYYTKHTSTLGRFKEIIVGGHKTVVYREREATTNLKTRNNGHKNISNGKKQEPIPDMPELSVGGQVNG